MEEVTHSHAQAQVESILSHMLEVITRNSPEMVEKYAIPDTLEETHAQSYLSCLNGAQRLVIYMLATPTKVADHAMVALSFPSPAGKPIILSTVVQRGVDDEVLLLHLLNQLGDMDLEVEDGCGVMDYFIESWGKEDEGPVWSEVGIHLRVLFKGAIAHVTSDEEGAELVEPASEVE
ncbi:hypothetical protein GTB64_004521 [Salmonella enterica]|nr:hypothetical protein [Salmonella enterica]